MAQSQDPTHSEPSYFVHTLPQIDLLADSMNIWDVIRGTDDWGNQTVVLESWSSRKLESRNAHDFDEAGEDGLWLLRTGVHGGDYPMY